MQKKNFIYVMLCVCVAFLISGCGKDAGKQKQPVLTVTPTAGALAQTGNAGNPTIVPLENLEITIYALNSDSLEKEAVSVLVTVEDELTPEVILEQVTDAMEDEGFYLGINDIIINGDSVRIDFKSDAAPVIDVGASVEGAILDILSQSILDNLPQYKKIYLSIEGNAYKTGHLEFKLDDVYLER